MNRKLVLVVAFSLIAVPLWAQDKAPKKLELKTNQDKTAYLIGVNYARSIRHQFEILWGFPFDADVALRGFRDGLGNGKLALTDDEMNEAATAVEEEVSKRNGAEGDAFLTANKKKKDITTLPSGLQYKVLKKGTGKSPTTKDVVTVHFRGRLVNGKEFFNTYTLKEPLTIAVMGTIAGWVEALPLMTVGSKWELYIPPDLAYGPTGNETVPPNATLVYEIELLDVAKPGAAGPGGPGGPPRGRSQPPETIK